MKPRLLTYLLLISFICFWGCLDELGTAEDVSETGTLTLNISPDAVSKVTSSGVLSDQEDKLIKTLTVWLVQDGTVKDLHTSNPNALSHTVTFTNVLRGDYKLYIVANYDGNLATNYPKGSNTLTGLQNYILGNVSAGTSPTYTTTTGIPSSLEMDISVAPGNNLISAHLKRAVGRLSIAFRNMTEHDLYVGDMSLSAYNPSQGYLFSQNHSLPGSSQYLTFPSLSGDPVKIGNETVVFDHYLYETGYPSSPFELAFDAGLYTSETAPTYQNTSVTTSKVTLGPNKSSLSTGNMFMIHSYASPKFYVGADDSGLVCTEFGSDANIVNSTVVDNYLWTFENGNYIKNVATGKYMTVSTSPGVSNDAVKMYVYDAGDYFYIRNDSNYYYLTLNTTNTGLTSVYNAPYYWHLREATRTTNTETKKAFTGVESTFLARMEKDHTHTMKYLDSYGVAQPLTHICRNEHIKLTVNVAYQQSTGGFDISVTDWTEKNNETTFD
ncbi:MAG: hypothetical protein IJV84_05290 [Bacteroidales bacterium]|nr:hypothetical protein [Bacteroidales bacterium]